VVIELNLVYEPKKLFVFIHCFKFHQIIHDTTAYIRSSNWQQVLAKRISWAPGLSLAVNVLKF